MLILARKVNERIIIGDSIEISVVDIRGDQVKLGIEAPRNVKVYRHEVFEAIQEENRAAATSNVTDLPEIDLFAGKKKNPSDKS
ncbi:MULTISPECIES: carbon storage regulator CsrA [Sediminispirochaeta]|jgi:carbon storage regulator|uniref:Translational regulator CsrA n=1 Tax=Sediminispirochaeta smaragdinae (strain DSM 11293 / JCM 15392 / SEBR 4228) TaxID=573413 RepID=E1R4H6_SEDSS|nr:MULTISPECIES: carbon storage regulator CsrA [Sediminispirochaeta]ADK81717.1 carbon storage regulator, CsrA [Sediminispirochaeta smaragdinae DSM 11293]